MTLGGGRLLVACALGVGACEVFVPDALPTFYCLEGPGTCPDGQTCDPSTHQCVAGASEGGGPLSEAGSEDAAYAGDAVDAVGVPPLPGCSTLGCACSGGAGCASGICGDLATVTQAVYAAADNTNFCTKPCCTSADCDSATVCFATAGGGSYCVRPEWLGRSALFGTALGGDPCEADQDCRSGLCTSAGCADVCCSTAQSASECGSGATCQFGTFPGRGVDKRYVAFCAPAVGSGSNNAICSSNSACRADLCAGDNRCHDVCRSTADCGDPSLECGYAITSLATGVIVTVCENTYGTVSPGLQGVPCQNNNQCLSGFCDATSMQCTDVCYGDSDCTVQGWRCRPEVVMFLVNASTTVLACGM